MLVIGRREGEEIRIGDDIVIKFIGFYRGRKAIQVGITAPREIPVHRQEVWEAIQAEKKASNEQRS
ncbi:hypothetical protein LCGC14_0434140 [marine sediment metagenome]|uniref:Carbon storage regulator n=1 Tax=marine sediment metagenome TaxID=412755 RepID=A0A0F9STG7_9ZZZZ